MSCTICAHARENFCWPVSFKGTHCKQCCRSWTGLAECHCVVCHEHFSSVGAYEAHQSERARCVDPSTHLTKDEEPVFKYRTTTFGQTWLLAGDRDLSWLPSSSSESPAADRRGVPVPA